MPPDPTPAAAPPAPAAATPAPTPAAPAAAPPAAAPAVTSLLDGAPAAPAADSNAPAAPATPAVAPAADPEWFYADGVKGTGKPPEWYLADKYKSVDEQARAYPELAKRFGGFTGAPKDGKYEFAMPEGIEGELDQTNPLLQGFNKWAAQNQLSQAAYNEVLQQFVQYEASLAPNMGDIKKELGDNADARIGAATAWAKANFDAAGYEQFRVATSERNAAAVLEVIEATIAKTRQPAMPKPGADVPAGQATGLEAINALQAERLPDGRRRFEIDAKFRAEVEAKRVAYFKGQAA